MKTNSPALILPSPSNATNHAGTNSLAAADIRDIKAPVNIPAGWIWLWCLLGALVLAAASYFAWRTWRKQRLRPAVAAVIVPPHERARRRLQEALELIAQPRPFCIRVSDALRLYLEEAFSLRAPERTTEEFLDELQSSPLLALSQKQMLGDFLMRCDLVKFARLEPPLEHLQELHRSALSLVDETAFLGQPALPGTPPECPEPPSKSPAPATGPAPAAEPESVGNGRS
jgi:hypothetical protein